MSDGIAKKRKRQDTDADTIPNGKGKSRKIENAIAPKSEEEILLLEEQVLRSRKHYNSIPTLLNYCHEDGGEARKEIITAAVALCRIFCRLMAARSMSKPRDAPPDEVTIVQWLRGQLMSYKETLLSFLSKPDLSVRCTALTLLMRLLKGESESLQLSSDDIWRKGAFPSLVSKIIDSGTPEAVREEFVEKYLQPYDDVRFYAFAGLSDACAGSLSEEVLDHVISILAMLDLKVAEDKSMDDLYIKEQGKRRHKVHNLAAHKKQAQELWLKILRSNLSRRQRKTVLNLMADQIVPSFTRLELLMDFLTDSFNAGGSISLAALSGLFHLMQEKNLDYPQFYTKLYSLLTSEILHSKHRSRFFRLLDTFLSSTHLPAALVASFIKRLARLTLFAPPAGIVVVVPSIYNLLKNHPTCTFMIHRRPEYSDFTSGEGMDDPFDMEEPDPMETDAIDSSLWEIHTLQSHYHPNVAAIAKILSEQFTKQAYNLEDFLDHSYSSMLNAELSKEIKKAPVIEYEIPSRIFLKHTDPKQTNNLLVAHWNFSWLGTS
ncbi:MAG: hypothetical protein Q9201_004336 [Fulgogasparrea decipioides]